MRHRVAAGSHVGGRVFIGRRAYSRACACCCMGTLLSAPSTRLHDENQGTARAPPRAEATLFTWTFCSPWWQHASCHTWSRCPSDTHSRCSSALRLDAPCTCRYGMAVPVGWAWDRSMRMKIRIAVRSGEKVHHTARTCASCVWSLRIGLSQLRRLCARHASPQSHCGRQPSTYPAPRSAGNTVQAGTCDASGARWAKTAVGTHLAQLLLTFRAHHNFSRN